MATRSTRSHRWSLFLKSWAKGRVQERWLTLSRAGRSRLRSRKDRLRSSTYRLNRPMHKTVRTASLKLRFASWPQIPFRCSLPTTGEVHSMFLVPYPFPRWEAIIWCRHSTQEATKRENGRCYLSLRWQTTPPLIFCSVATPSTGIMPTSLFR